MQTKYRELTYEEACTLYDAGLREGVEYWGPIAGEWLPDMNFCPAEYLRNERYRIPINEE